MMYAKCCDLVQRLYSWRGWDILLIRGLTAFHEFQDGDPQSVSWLSIRQLLAVGNCQDHAGF